MACLMYSVVRVSALSTRILRHVESDTGNQLAATKETGCELLERGMPPRHVELAVMASEARSERR